MTVRARIEERYTLHAVEKKKYFQKRLLHRIREQIGTDNIDQAIRERILVDICTKITSIYIGCFSAVEQSLGETIWAYEVEPERFHNMSYEDQQRYKIMSAIWEDCKASIKHIGVSAANDIIGILHRVEFVPKSGEEVLDYEARQGRQVADYLTERERRCANKKIRRVLMTPLYQRGCVRVSRLLSKSFIYLLNIRLHERS